MTVKEWGRQLSGQNSLLGTLLLSYFTQDWLDEYGEPWTKVVDAFVADGGSDAAMKAADELRRLLADGLDPADLDALIWNELRTGIDWDRFGYPSMAAWFTALYGELQRPRQSVESDS